MSTATAAAVPFPGRQRAGRGRVEAWRLSLGHGAGARVDVMPVNGGVDLVLSPVSMVSSSNDRPDRGVAGVRHASSSTTASTSASG